MTQAQIDFLKVTEGIEDIIVKKPVTFVHGDNMAFLRKFKEEMMFKYFHVGIVDPPYGISVGNMNLGATKESKPRNYEMGDWDNEIPTREYWYLLNYCCRHLIIWGGNYFTRDYADFLILTLPNDKEVVVETMSYDTITGLYNINGKEVQPKHIKSLEIKKGIPSGRCALSWDKLNNGMSFADFELALTTFDSNARVIKKSRNAKGADDGEKRHPTQKPVYLYDYLHLEFVERGQRVLDTHGGSFSHAIAAYKNNVDLTIIERNKSYLNDGIDAYNNASKKGILLF